MATPNFVMPTSAELMQIAQTLIPNLQANRPIFRLMPIRSVEASMVMWEQLDRFTGLQAWRGLNGKPATVKQVGVRRFSVEPGVYGEMMPLDEKTLTQRRNIGTFADPVNVTDLVMERQSQLLVRRLDRIELIGWNILSGIFSVLNDEGAVVHTDTFPVQTFETDYPWSDHLHSTPLADLRSVRLKHRGYSVDFGASAQALANQVTINDVLQNQNPDDLYGRRQQGLSTINNLAGLNQLLTGDNLPTLTEYDGFYLDDNGDPQTFIPDGEVKVVGQRPMGQTVAEYQMTRNVNNPGFAPGAYMKVIVVDDEVPLQIQVHDGHNGGPCIFFPSAVVKMDVTHNNH